VGFTSTLHRSKELRLANRAMRGGDSSTVLFHGPGINNWDMALVKDTAISERVNLQLRAELFNIFNHTQFLGPSGISSFLDNRAKLNAARVSTTASFGQVAGAAAPRIGQLSLKLNF
jgi:hypothetical protein